jgi:ribosomal protein S18 acetylase RimI-like enzyme
MRSATKRLRRATFPSHPDCDDGRVSDIAIRRATADDIPAIVEMLLEGTVDTSRESPDDLTPYRRAFADVHADPNQLLMVAERNGQVIGTLQLTIIPGLSRAGSSRGQIEAVRVAEAARGSGLGSVLMEWAIEESRRRGCRLVQLTSDVQRTDAHRFYERLGFTGSHVGYKLKLS